MLACVFGDARVEYPLWDAGRVIGECGAQLGGGDFVLQIGQQAERALPLLGAPAVNGTRSKRLRLAPVADTWGAGMDAGRERALPVHPG